MHVAVLVGLTMTLYSAIYLLFPIVTNGAKLYSEKLAIFHFWAHLLGGIGMGAFMGMAGLQGMLRRSLYVNGEFNVYMILAALSGSLLLLAFLAFFYNIVMSLGPEGRASGSSRRRSSTRRTLCRRADSAARGRAGDKVESIVGRAEYQLVFADVTVARRIERAEAGMSASMVSAVSRRSGTEVFVEPIGEGYAIYAGPGSPFNKIIGAGLDGAVHRRIRPRPGRADFRRARSGGARRDLRARQP